MALHTPQRIAKLTIDAGGRNLLVETAYHVAYIYQAKRESAGQL